MNTIKRRLHISFIFLLMAGIISMINPFDNSSNAVAQTAEVECYDVETVGEGYYSHRICVKDGSAYCEVDYYSDYISTGKCIFGPSED